MTQALSTVVNTSFATRLHANRLTAVLIAQGIANENESPCGIWTRDGWYTACEVPPEMIEPDPELSGWTLACIVDPLS